MELNEPVVLVLLLLSSLLMTLLAMPLVIKLAHRIGAVDQPDARKVHRSAMPRMGGLAFLLCLFVMPLSMLPISALQISNDLQGFLIGLVVITLTGLADDMLDISPRWKFLGLIAGSLLFVLISDAAIYNLGDLFYLGEIETGMLAIPITVVATVGFINALNLSDGLDGLAAGIALIAVFFLGFFSLHAGDHLCLVLSLTLFGGMVGFLYFNSHPARVFMGDTGSLVLGYVLAAISLLLIKYHGAAETPISPVMMGVLLALPLSDTLFVMGKRVLAGTSPFQPDKTHFHHRLMHLGLTHNGVVGTIYVIMIFYGIAAIAMINIPAWGQMLALVGMIVFTYGGLHLVEKSGRRMDLNEVAPAVERAGSDARLFRTMTRLTGASIPFVTWLVPLFLLYPVLSVDLHKPLAGVVAAIIVLVMLLYPWREKHDATWSNGLFYLLVFTAILVVNSIAGDGVKDYLLYVTGALALWVALKLYFRRHGRIFLSTGLEILLLLLSWVAPWMIVKFGMVPEALQESLYLTCFQAVVFLLATKIVLRHQPGRNRQLLISLLVINGLLFL